MTNRLFALYAWGVLLFNVLVIIWGAYVRATGSGAGCGSHWPLCNGDLLPDTAQQATFIEFAHRMSSGLALLLVVGQVAWIRLLHRRGSAMRLAGWAALGFIVTEALLGAGLVVFKLVAENTSVMRAIWMALHLGNTFFLLVPLTLIAWWAAGGKPLQARPDGLLLLLQSIALVGTLVLGVSGAVAALGDTLFPAASLRAALEQDLAPTTHLLIRLRIWHPFIAVMLSLYLLFAAWLTWHRVGTRTVQRLALLITILFGLQLVVGAINVVLLAPVAIQLIHLLLAVLIWVGLVLQTAEVLAWRRPAYQPVKLRPAPSQR